MFVLVVVPGYRCEVQERYVADNLRDGLEGEMMEKVSRVMRMDGEDGPDRSGCKLRVCV